MNIIHLGRRRYSWMNATALTVLGAVIATVVTTWGSSAVATSASQQATLVAVAMVIQKNVTAWDDFSGRLEPVNHVDLRPRVSGTVQAVHFREGAIVKAGDLLFTIDDAPYRLELERADAHASIAAAQLERAQTELERAQKMRAEHTIASGEFEEYERLARAADADARAAQVQLQTARLNLSYTQVRAPVGGRVGRVEVTPGNLVASGPTAPTLTTLVSVSPIYASFSASEELVSRTLRKLPHDATDREALEAVTVQVQTADQQRLVTGHLQLVDDQVDPGTGTVRIRAVFNNNDEALIPGQLARVRMSESPTAGALLVSDKAVTSDQNRKFVWVVGSDNRVYHREVTLGAIVNGLRVVTSGLKAKERIVLDGLQRVREGAVIAPQLAAMDANEATGQL